jgi:hypothetical protein
MVRGSWKKGQYSYDIFCNQGTICVNLEFYQHYRTTRAIGFDIFLLEGDYRWNSNAMAFNWNPALNKLALPLISPYNFTGGFEFED